MVDSSKYIGLIPSSNRDRPNFSAMVGLVSGCFADINNATVGLPQSFDLDVAVGAQLDVIGIWVGFSRQVQTPISGVYFSLDTVGLGLDQGSWQSPYDPSTGITLLDDETYRSMLRAKIGANSWDGSLVGYRSVMQSAFASLGVTVVPVDNQDMTMDVYIFGAIVPAIVISLLENGFLQMKPEGVHINGYHFNPVFGFDEGDAYVAGFDTGYLTGHI